MYAYYHEHFEINTWSDVVKVTCVCGKDFIWSVKKGAGVPHRCPHCKERWILGYVGNILSLTRVKTGAKIVMHLENKDALSIITDLFENDKPKILKE
ncbi:hypothetical protein [Thermoanaerobacterium sp. DL9XJH110]|uniref:hypothetical protein n=1 Tax=Thermoanaerobacterium sp. DL9XJH110 TaxID=3386643 RepID=UPI003BB6E3AF